MQIMPTTSAVIAGVRSLARRNRARLDDPVYSMTLGQGGPLDSTKPLVLMIYETAFGHFQMGYATAQTVVLFGSSWPSRCSARLLGG
jgi:ABC-type sugar transport system permease subunit